MEEIVSTIRRFLSDEEGVTAIEYGLIAALIAVVILVAVALIGSNLNAVFQRIANCVSIGATCS